MREEERSTTLTPGPLEYLVVGFEGNRFTGQILLELRTAREKGIICVIDLLFVMKDAHGNIAVMELSDHSDKEAQQIGPIAGDLLQVLELDDIEAASSTIPNTSSAVLLLIEQTWDVSLQEAIINAGGISLAEGLVAPTVVQLLETDLAASAAR